MIRNIAQDMPPVEIFGGDSDGHTCICVVFILLNVCSLLSDVLVSLSDVWIVMSAVGMACTTTLCMLNLFYLLCALQDQLQ